MTTTAPSKRVKANAGDLLQYHYDFVGFGGMNDSTVTTSRILSVVDDGAAFVVEGMYTVEAKQVITVIPMHEEQITEEGF
jgi:hypothetical protein